MDADARWTRVEESFLEALDMAPEARQSFLATLRDEDASLAEEVRVLLEGHDRPGFVDALASESRGEETGPSEDPPGSRFGPYAVDSVLGRGGMGIVYRAHRADGQFRQEVALKVLPADLLSRRPHERFLAEREILARLSHPNIARLLDGGVDNRGRPYFAMELVEGRTLLDFCDDKRMSLIARVELFITVCEAVQHAHQNLVVHRDLKPGNILVTASGQPKLLDFGISKLLDAEGGPAAETQVGTRLFTPAYAAPEQLKGQPANTASDVYQLGILLFELLSGTHPFPQRRHTDGERGAWEDAAGEPTRPSVAATSGDPGAVATRAQVRAVPGDSLRRGLEGDLDAITMKALRPEPADRYSSVAGLADDLHRFLAHRPVRARRDSWAYRARLFGRRNRPAIAVTVAGLVGALAFTAGIVRESRRTALERDRAEAVSAFMTNLFASADPFRVNRSEMAVRDVLDEGLAELRRDESTDPQVRASLLLAIGRAYEGLGITRAAVEAAMEGWALLEVTDDVAPGTMARATADVGNLLTVEGRFAEARPFLESADSWRSSVRGEMDARTEAALLAALGAGWLRAGEAERTAPYLEGAVDLYLSLGDALEDAAGSLGDLARVHRDRGDADSAEVLLRRGLELRERSWGPDHLWVANSLEPLADLMRGTGRLDAAEELLERALAIRRQGLPPDHYLVGTTHAGMASLAGAREQPERADSLFGLALASYRASFGDRHFSVGRVLNERAIVRQRTGRGVEAEADYDAALQIFEEYYGPDHPYTAAVATNLAWVSAGNGKTTEAVELYRRALPVLRAAGPEDMSVYGHMTDLGIILCRQGDPAGEAPLREAIGALGVMEPGADRDLRARNALGSCLMGLGRMREAAPILEGVLSAAEDRPADDPFRAFAEGVLAQIASTGGDRRRD